MSKDYAFPRGYNTSSDNKGIASGDEIETDSVGKNNPQRHPETEPGLAADVRKLEVPSSAGRPESWLMRSLGTSGKMGKAKG